MEKLDVDKKDIDVLVDLHKYLKGFRSLTPGVFLVDEYYQVSGHGLNDKQIYEILLEKIPEKFPFLNARWNGADDVNFVNNGTTWIHLLLTKELHFPFAYKLIIHSNRMTEKELRELLLELGDE